MKYAAVIKNHHSAMTQTLESIFLKSDNEMQNGIKAFLKRQIFAQNWLWCRTVSFLYSEILKQNMAQAYNEFANETVTEETLLGFLHISQEFAKYIRYEDIHGKYGYIESIILSRDLLQYTENVDVQVAEDFSRIKAIQADDEQNVLSNR